jgi:hypothetical protein
LGVIPCASREPSPDNLSHIEQKASWTVTYSVNTKVR